MPKKGQSIENKLDELVDILGRDNEVNIINVTKIEYDELSEKGFIKDGKYKDTKLKISYGLWK